ncbi:ttcA, partial [Symbiodinium microadriaticum]
VEFVQRCVEFVADHGVLFLPQYRYNYRTGDWAHTTRLTKFPERRWLSRFDPLLAPSAAAADNVRADWLGEESYFQTSLMSAEAEVQRLLTENRKKLAKVTKVGAESTDRPLEDAALTPYENIRWFALMSDFPGNIPVHLSSADECSDTVALQGPIRPNFYFDADAAGGSRTPRYNRGTHEPSLYAQKRDKKMSSRGGASTVAPTLPRYADPSTIVGIVDKNSIGDTEVGTAASAAMNKSKCTALPQQPTGSGEAVPDPVPAPMCIAASRPPVQHSNATKLLSGVGMVFGADKTDASSSGGAAVATSCGGDDSYTPNLGDGSTGRAKVATPPKKILKPVGQAIADWGMIEEGDRLLLGLSGGKDSLTLLHILLHLQRKAPVNFTIACATVDPQTESFDPSPLIPYMQSLGVTYHYLSEPIVELAKSKMQGDSLCAFCARFKRGLLYSCCRNNGYNKLVLAQHLDDLAESFIMSSLHNGKLRTMKAHYKIDAEDLSVIRPLAYTREAHT